MPTLHKDPFEAALAITRDNLGWASSIGQVTGPITFGFRLSAPAYNHAGSNERGTFSQVTAAEKVAAETVLGSWADVARISFSEVNSAGYTNAATILFANYNSSTDGSQAFAFYGIAGATAAASAAGDIWLNIRYQATASLPYGSYSYLTLIHEVGHALGLEHPGDYDTAPGVSITYANSAEYVEDSRQFSVMSYFDASNTGANHRYDGQTVFASTPLLDDIAAIQRLYGANLATRTGDDTYGFHSTAGTPYALGSATDQKVFTVYDAGGNDTLDFSGYVGAQRIDLTAGAFSDVGALTKNVSIAVSVTIENAIGGGGRDTIVGNCAANALSGGAGNDSLTGAGGNDRLDGGAGIDTAVFAAASAADALVSYNGTIAVLNAGAEGHDRLFNVELLQFSDKAIAGSAVAGFDPLNYIASYDDLVAAFHANGQAGFDHYVEFGFSEGRHAGFDALGYVASYGDLIRALGSNAVAGEQHYLEFGFNEGRQVGFEALAYIASYGDLIGALGDNATAGELHYIQFGFDEGRQASFDALTYIASYGDLITSLGADPMAGERHFIEFGFQEGRAATFDASAYLADNPDLQAALGNDLQAATLQYIQEGFADGRY